MFSISCPMRFRLPRLLYTLMSDGDYNISDDLCDASDRLRCYLYHGRSSAMLCSRHTNNSREQAQFEAKVGCTVWDTANVRNHDVNIETLADDLTGSLWSGRMLMIRSCKDGRRGKYTDIVSPAQMPFSGECGNRLCHPTQGGSDVPAIGMDCIGADNNGTGPVPPLASGGLSDAVEAFRQDYQVVRVIGLRHVVILFAGRGCRQNDRCLPYNRHGRAQFLYS